MCGQAEPAGVRDALAVTEEHVGLVVKVPKGTEERRDLPEAEEARDIGNGRPGLGPSFLQDLEGDRLQDHDPGPDGAGGAGTGHVHSGDGADLPRGPGAMAEALAFSGLEAGELDVTFLAPEDPAAAVLLEKALVLHLPEPVEEAVQEIKPTAPGMDPSKPPILR